MKKDKKDTHIKLRGIKGKITDNSPFFKAKIARIAQIIYIQKPKIRNLFVANKKISKDNCSEASLKNN